MDLRDGQVTLYDGDYAYYKEKRAELLAAEAGQGAPAAPSAKGQPAGQQASGTAGAAKASQPGAPQGRNVKTREQRRAEAEARNARRAKTKRERERLKQVEAALEPAQKRYDELMGLMATQELYDDAARFDAAMKEYEALSKKIPKLEEEWLELQATLEEAERDDA